MSLVPWTALAKENMSLETDRDSCRNMLRVPNETKENFTLYSTERLPKSRGSIKGLSPPLSQNNVQSAQALEVVHIKLSVFSACCINIHIF